MPIPTIYLIGLLTHGFHSHFIQIWYTLGGSFGWNIVCHNTFLCFQPYWCNMPYLCFFFICWWYAYCWPYFGCGTYFLTIISKICYIRTFDLISKVNSLYFVGIKLVHIKKKIGFLTPNAGFHILGALMDFMPFVKSFVAKAF